MPNNTETGHSFFKSRKDSKEKEGNRKVKVKRQHQISSARPNRLHDEEEEEEIKLLTPLNHASPITTQHSLGFVAYDQVRIICRSHHSMRTSRVYVSSPLFST